MSAIKFRSIFALNILALSSFLVFQSLTPPAHADLNAAVITGDDEEPIWKLKNPSVKVSVRLATDIEIQAGEDMIKLDREGRCRLILSEPSEDHRIKKASERLLSIQSPIHYDSYVDE